MDIKDQLLLTIVPGLIIAIVTSIVTVRLSLKQFYSQKWWERKVEVYSAIIDALFHIQVHAQTFFEVEIGISYLSDEQKKELKDRTAKAYSELSRTVAIGSFIISRKAIDSLNKLQESREKMEMDSGLSPADYLDAVSAEVKKCLPNIIEIARKDLQIN